LADTVLNPSESSAEADHERGGFIAAVVASHALKHALTSGISGVIMPEIKRSLGLSATQVGSLGSIQQFTGWFATIGAGYLGDRFTRRTGVLLAFSIGITATSLLLMGFARSYLMLVVAMLCLGFGPSMFHPPAVGSLSRRFADRRSFAISLHGTGGSIGEVLGPLVGAGLLSLLFWRNVLRVEFVPGIAAALFLFIRLKDAKNQEGGSDASFRTYLGSLAVLLKRRALILILLVTAFRSVGQSTTAIFLPIYLRENLGYSSGLIGLYVSMSQLAGIGSQPLMGHLSDRFGHKRVIMPALIAFAILLALVPLADGKLPLAITILALGFFLFSMQSILTSAAVDMAGHEVHSSVVSLIYASSFIGSLAPTVAGVLGDAYGLRSTFYFSAGLAAVAAVILSLTNLPARKRVEA
jgi:MFS family permease